MNDTPTLADAQIELANANAAYVEASEKNRNASREQTAALNRLNEAQKKFSAAVDAIKNEAPPDTNWGAAAYGVNR